MLRKTLVLLFLFLPSSAGCALTPAPAPAVLPTSTLLSPTDWQTLAPGLDMRVYHPGGARLAELRVLRIDPAHYTLRAHYRSGAPLSLAEWRAVLPQPVAFVNANFFTPDYTVLGLLVADGVVYGRAYTDRGGTLLVQNGQPRIRANWHEPYNTPDEPLEQAVQGFPLLVQDGLPAFVGQPGDRIARRTAVGQDHSGRVLLMVTPFLGLTLADLSAFLAESDLDLLIAFNLDGGGSSLMYHIGSPPLALPSVDPVPAVLAVYPREAR